MLTLALEVTSFELDLQVTHCPFINPSVIPFFLLALPLLLGDSEGISRIYLYFFFFPHKTSLLKKQVKQLLIASSLYCTFNFSQNGRLADSKHRQLVLAGGLAVRNTEVGQRHGIPHFA